MEYDATQYVFPARHETLQVRFYDPSPAMQAWVRLDTEWHATFDMYGGCVPTKDAADIADHVTKGE